MLPASIRRTATATTTAVAVALLLDAGAAGAADRTIPGRTAVVKAQRMLKFTSKSAFALPAPGGSADPTRHGAELHVFDTGDAAGAAVFTLPASGWTALGVPSGARGYRYRGSRATPPDPTCRSVLLGAKTISAVCKGAAVTLRPPFAGQAAVVLGLPAGTAGVSAGTAAATRYCAQFGGQVRHNHVRLFKARDAAPPPACAAVPPPPTPTGPLGTATATRTPTISSTPTISPTPTATRPTATPTATPAFGAARRCTLASSSRLEINAQAFPLTLDMRGSLLLASTPPDGDQLAATQCEIEAIDPISIPSIGYVCVEPAPGCPAGLADCDGGTALGIDLRANGNIGACLSQASGNADCAASCASFCAASGRSYRASGCTARCAESERVCSEDDECASAGEGACNGPDPVGSSQRNICQCQCLNQRAGAPGGAGTRQCELGANINLEQGPPCGDGDIRVVIGRTCLPLTTATATVQINNANFSSNSVPGAPASNTGAALACAAVDANPSGLGLRGAATFFGSTLGDLAVELFADCQ